MEKGHRDSRLEDVEGDEQGALKGGRYLEENYSVYRNTGYERARA